MKFYIFLLLILLFDAHLARHAKHDHKKSYLRHSHHQKSSLSLLKKPQAEQTRDSDEDMVLYDAVPGQDSDSADFQEVDYVSTLSPEVLQDVKVINNPTGVIEVGKDEYKIGERTFYTTSVYEKVELKSTPTKSVEGLEDSERAALWNSPNMHDYVDGETTYQDVQMADDPNVISRDNPIIAEEVPMMEVKTEDDIDPTIAFAPVEIREETAPTENITEHITIGENSDVDAAQELDSVVLIPKKEESEDLGSFEPQNTELSDEAFEAIDASDDDAFETIDTSNDETFETIETSTEPALLVGDTDQKDEVDTDNHQAVINPEEEAQDLEDVQSQLLKDLEDNLKAIKG